MDKIKNGGNQVCAESNNVSVNGTSVQNPKTENVKLYFYNELQIEAFIKGKIQIAFDEWLIKGIQENKTEYIKNFNEYFIELCYIYNISHPISVANIVLNDIYNNKLKEYYNVKIRTGYETRLFIEVLK